MWLNVCMQHLAQKIWSLPFLLFVFGVAVYITWQLRFVQFRYFFKSIALMFSSSEKLHQTTKVHELSPLQAFINTLGSNIGNGSLAGIAVAIYVGGPGSIIWLLVLATVSASLRYSEVFLGTYVIDKFRVKSARGGPVVYMSLLPGGTIWSYVFTVLSLAFMFSAGSLAQSHAVGSAVYKLLGVNQVITGLFIFGFITYVFLGGAQRIVAILDKLVPLKVGLFLVSSIIVLLYHYQNIPYALHIMFASACDTKSILGGSFAFGLQRIGFQQSVFASEAGLGTSAIAFGSTQGGQPVQSGILAMLGVFINIHVICFLTALCLLVSGVWSGGETSSAMIIAAYETVFGYFGGWIVLLLVINFAMSVLIACAYNGKCCWDFLFSGKFSYIFPLFYCVLAFCGAWMNVSLVWNITSIVNAILLLINLLGLLWSMKIIKSELQLYSSKVG